MEYVLDTHTHSLASGHSYSTIREMAHMAGEKGLELLGITEHAPAMQGTCHRFYFQNLKVVQRSMCGVELLLGAELNIIDLEGRVDLDTALLRQMDITIASMHPPCLNAGTAAENTRAYIKAMKNPYVNVIGHPDDGRFPVDYKELVMAAGELGVLLEVNNASLSPNAYRLNSRGNAVRMLEYCKDYQVPVVLGSDAHVDTDVGNFTYAREVLEQVGFPKRLVVNHSTAELKKYINRFK